MLRIVSLIASATEIVHALGMGEYLVGRSHECDFPTSVQTLPICTAPKFAVSGSSRDIDAEVKQTLRKALSVYEVSETELERLQPTHIITQSQCEVCAVSLKDVEAAVADRVTSQPQIVSLRPNCLADVWNDIRIVSEALGTTGEGHRLVRRLRSEMQSISNRASLAEKSLRVACIEWIEPLMAAGNWVPELVAMAGGINVFGEAGRHSPWMTWEQLVEQDPDVIVVMPCGFNIRKVQEEMYWLVDRREWTHLKAVSDSRVYLTDGNQFFNRPGSRLVESLQILAEVLHPGLFDPSLMGMGWSAFQT